MPAETPKSRVFIFGAGFSKPAQMPDARELTRLLLEKGHYRDNAEFKRWIDDFQQRLANLESGAHANERLLPNIEQLFDYAQFDRELFLMRQQELPVGRRWGVTFDQNAESIAAWLSFMQDDLVDVLLSAQQDAAQENLDPFVAQLRPGDIVVTFNYDTLLEARIEASGKSWSHGFEVEPSADVVVLKLHGSLDWWMWHRDRLNGGRLKNRKFEKFTLLFEKVDRNMDWNNASPAEKVHADYEYQFVLLRANSLDVVRSCNEQRTGVSPGEPPQPGLGGLGAHKPLHRLVGSGAVWGRAFGALKKADEIYIVGWSCSPYDAMARFHFASVMRLRESLPSRMIVVDPNADGILGRLSAVFGRGLTPASKCSEDLDWADILADPLSSNAAKTARAEARDSQR